MSGHCLYFFRFRPKILQFDAISYRNTTAICMFLHDFRKKFKISHIEWRYRCIIYTKSYSSTTRKVLKIWLLEAILLSFCSPSKYKATAPVRPDQVTIAASTVRLQVSDYSQLSEYTVRLQLYRMINEYIYLISFVRIPWIVFYIGLKMMDSNSEYGAPTLLNVEREFYSINWLAFVFERYNT